MTARKTRGRQKDVLLCIGPNIILVWSGNLLLFVIVVFGMHRRLSIKSYRAWGAD